MFTETNDYRLDIVADLDPWRAFVTVAEVGSLTRAAIILDTSPSLLSRRLNNLERDCKLRLFERNGRGMKLSDVGRSLFADVKALLGQACRLEQSIRNDRDQIEDSVTIGLVPSLVMPMVAALYDRLQTLHPALQLKVVEGSAGWIEERLAAARIDVGILYRPGTPPLLEQALATVNSYLVGPEKDELTSRPEIAFTELDTLPLIIPGSPNAFRVGLERLSRKCGLSLRIATESDSLQLAKSLVTAGRGYTVLPLHAVWLEIKEGRLQASKIVTPELKLTITMAQATSKSIPRAVSAVADQIAVIIAEMAGEGLWTQIVPRVDRQRTTDQKRWS